MKVVFNLYTYIYAEDHEEFKKIHDFVHMHLRYTNPANEVRANSGKEFYDLFEINYNQKYFKLPKNVKKLIEDLIKYGIKITGFENQRINKKENIGFKANFEPRDEQQKISIERFFEVPDKHATLGALCG